MSLMGTLAKVAMGIAVAKGVGKMMGGGRKGGSGGGLGDLLGGLTGGASKGGSGGLGGILDSLGGGSKISNSEGNNGSGLGDLFNNALQGKEAPATNQQEEEAKVLLRAMIYAARADGHLDDNEKQKITEKLGDVSEEEANFVRHELSAPIDVKGFINSVPRGMEEQTYMMSLLAIDLDSNEEAHYLDQLAKGLNMSHQVCNEIHEKLGAPAIYT